MTLTLAKSKETLRNLHAVITEWEKWEPTPEQKQPYLGIGVKPVGKTVQDAITTACETFQVIDVEESAMELVMFVDTFFAEFSRWMIDLQSAPDGIHPGGSTEMWATYRDVHDNVSKKRLPVPANADLLLKQGDNPRTIAVKYGWYTDDGRPDIPRVNAELVAAPKDRQYDANTWIHPREKRFRKETKVKFTERNIILKEKLTTGQGRPERMPNLASISELADMPHMSLHQIAIMKMMTEDEVQVELDELGYVKTSDGFRRANERGYRKRGDRDPEWLTQHDPHDECGDDHDARIVAIYDDGLMKPKSIADLLSGAKGIAITPQKAAQVIRRHKESLKPVEVS